MPSAVLRKIVAFLNDRSAAVGHFYVRVPFFLEVRDQYHASAMRVLSFNEKFMACPRVCDANTVASERLHPSVPHLHALRSVPEFETSIAGRALSQSVPFISSTPINSSPAVARGFSLAPPGAPSISPAPRKDEGLGGNLWRAVAFMHRELIEFAYAPLAPPELHL
jgi:hypothetical protein